MTIKIQCQLKYPMLTQRCKAREYASTKVKKVKSWHTKIVYPNTAIQQVTQFLIDTKNKKVVVYYWTIHYTNDRQETKSKPSENPNSWRTVQNNRNFACIRANIYVSTFMAQVNTFWLLVASSFHSMNLLSLNFLTQS